MKCKFIIYNWAHENKVFDFLVRAGLKTEQVYEEDLFDMASRFLKNDYNVMIYCASKQHKEAPYDYILYVDTKRFTQR